MSAKRITKLSSDEVKAMKDRTREDAPEGPSLGTDFWKDAAVTYPAKPKKALSVRFDEDIVEWFKKQGKGYQTHMNAVLRSYVEAHREGRE